MQEIKLTTENSDTVHVDSVDVSKGVYCKYHGTNDLHFVIVENGAYTIMKPFGEKYNYKTTLFDLMNHYTGYHFFTIPENRRIVTEKPLTVEPNSIVGIDYADGTKGWIVCLEEIYRAISFEQRSGKPNGYIAERKLIENLVNFLLVNGNRLFVFAAYDEEWASWLTKK